MGRKTGPFVNGVFLPDGAIVAPPVDPNITTDEFAAQIEREMQEPCDDCGEPVAVCDCGAHWIEAE